MDRPKHVVIVGAGPGTGAALARKFGAEGGRISLMARGDAYLKELAEELRGKGIEAKGIVCDVSDADQIPEAFEQARQGFGPVDILIFHAGDAVWKGLMDSTPGEFEYAWRVTVQGAFLCSRQAACDMVSAEEGVILFTGATSSVRGRSGAIGFSSAKFGLRGLAQSMAAELWPQGVHVAHVLIDGMIDTPRVRKEFRPQQDEPLLDPEPIAEAYWSLAQQKPGAWTWELDLRPQNEAFFE